MFGSALVADASPACSRPPGRLVSLAGGQDRRTDQGRMVVTAGATQSRTT
jgi:hypothetical protein